jgi:hypothetical protein
MEPWACIKPLVVMEENQPYAERQLAAPILVKS